MSCNVCGAVGDVVAEFSTSVSSESKVLPAASSLLLCRRCGLLHTRTDLDFPAYYAKQYDATLTDDGMDEIVSTTDGRVVFRTDIDYALMKSFIEPLVNRDAVLFEFGCGHGRILSRLSKDGYENLNAFDLSEKYRPAMMKHLAAAAVHIGKRPEIRCDLAYSFFVLEHDTAPVDSLRYLHSQIRPGGHLFLMLPNYVTNLGDLACADHVNHFSGRYLRMLVESCGFRVSIIDETSNIGATIVVARREGEPHLVPSDASLVEYAKETSQTFLEYLNEVDRIVGELEPGAPVYLYGAGFYGAMMAARLRARQVSVAGVFDANPRKAGGAALGVRVVAADRIVDGGYGKATLLICVNPKISQQIATRYRPHFARVFG